MSDDERRQRAIQNFLGGPTQLPQESASQPRRAKRSEPDSRVADFKKAGARARRKNPFKPGDLIQQCADYRCYQWPEIGFPAIVTEVFEPVEARNRKHPTRNCSDREDIIALVLVREKNGEERWVEFTMESWRFDKFEDA